MHGCTVDVQFVFPLYQINVRRTSQEYNMKSTNWWKYLLAVLVVGASGVIFMGFSTYKDAPPKPDYISPSGVEIVQKAAVERGQLVFQRYALMEYGSMFGDGAARGPDFTAEALHRVAVEMNDFYGQQVANGNV